jgi:hypothetical protein
MGGMGGLGGMMQGMGSHRASVRTPPHSSSSFYSTDEAFWAYNFSGLIPDAIPSVVYPHGVPPPPGGHPHVPASVASPTAPAVSPLPASSPTPASAPASSSPGGCIASMDDSASRGLPSAPSDLMASVAEEDYDSDPEFCWTGDKDGVVYSVDSNSCKSNNRVAPYPSCSHAAVVSASLPSFPPMGLSSPLASSSRRDSLVDHSDLPSSISSALHSLLARLSQCPIAPGSGGRLAIADSGATNHMFPDKSAFISYKTTSNLRFAWGITLTFLFLLGVPPLSPSMASESSFGMHYTYRALLSLSIAFGHISSNAVVVSLVPTTLACLFTSHLLFFQSTILRTAI